MQASQAGLELMQELLAGRSLSEVTTFAADVGPGSFTGVKVGVTLAKTLAWTQNCSCGAVSSFDLIAPGGSAAVPIRRGVVLRRDFGTEASLVTDAEALEVAGYGLGRTLETFPLAERMRFSDLRMVSPEAFVPEYLVEPSISVAKKPLIMGDTNG
jgi:tRNA threonylcarbamoyladenosine biosynthesis protein TsaB